MIVPGSANSLLLAQGASTGYNLTKSLRFRNSAVAYLNRTPASASNRKTFTWSGWIKTTLFNYYSQQFAAGNNNFVIKLNGGNGNTYSIEVYQYNGGYDLQLISTAVYRDPSAWYHLVVAVDTTQATASNRIKVYVNGSQVTSFSTATYPTQNLDTFVNSTNPHYHNAFGSSYLNTTYVGDQYMTEINFIDGQTLTPSSFGSTNADTGVWQPARYTGTYGTNGFYLPFTDVATTSGSNAGLGKDFSGNGNYWTTNNISVTSGSTYDSMTDVPTLTSATTANYCVLNPISNPNSPLYTISNGNLSYSCSASAGNAARMAIFGTILLPTTGKYYWEATETSSNSAFGISTYLVAGSGSQVGSQYAAVYPSSTSASAATYSGTTPSYTNGDVIGLAFDAVGLTLGVYKNGTYLGQFSGLESSVTNWLIWSGVNTGSASTSNSWNFGQQGFKYIPPTGYVALNTYNLPTSTIQNGGKYMDATIYTGDGSQTKSFTNTYGFKPDLVWSKIRSGTTQGTGVFDSVRGTTGQSLDTAAITAEGTWNGALSSEYGYVSSFDSNGFSVNDGSVATTGGYVNYSSRTYVAWQWQAGQGTTSSNTNGSITSTVSVNASAGFSIVTYTGTGSNATIGHGLGVAPSMIIVKTRTNSDWWPVYHASLGATKDLRLNETAAAETLSNIWNNTAPTSSVFSVGTSTETGASSNNYVAYCWSEIAGFSKAFSYTGNGSASGPFVYLGFRARYLMIKRTDSAGGWFLVDTARNPYNIANLDLFANTSDAEAAINNIDILSNGFRPTDSNSGTNANNGTFVGMAFAENPFKNALAR